jgi:DNA (cytosine-5)-methyltransferase 1
LTKQTQLEAIRFIDLFAGIGGFHLAFEDAIGSRANCVLASEWDDHARQTYMHNFSGKIGPIDDKEGRANGKYFVGDITKITERLEDEPELIPDFDVMCGGFPCQPFSNAGLRKGLEEARGTLFFNMLAILQAKISERKPVKAFFLENVRGLLNHRSGDKFTIDIIRQNLEALGYSFHVFQVKASDHGVPQYRPRLFMIGFFINGDKHKGLPSYRQADEKFVAMTANYANQVPRTKISPSLAQILGGKVVDGGREIGYTLRVGGRGSGLGDRRNWDTYLVDGRVVRVEKQHGLRMQGFPKTYTFPKTVSDSQAMKQLGNSVAVPAIRYFVDVLVQALDE